MGGTVSGSSNRYQLKDGTWKQAKPHWKFQSQGLRGKHRYVHVPAACVDRVKELVENGKQYQELESEYARLVTETSLAGTGENGIALPQPRFRRVEDVVAEPGNVSPEGKPKPKFHRIS